MKDDDTAVERDRTVEIEHIEGFQFRLQFGGAIPPLVADEPPPLGEGEGPDAARLLAGAIGNCLSASLLLCLQKSRVTVRELRTGVTLSIARNEQGRLRVSRGAVRIVAGVDGDVQKLERCTRMFEDYCIVTATVRRAFPIDVHVVDPDGREIYASAVEAP